MRKIKLLGLRLSSNPNATVDPSGKFNVTSDGRLYLIAEFSDPNNPFGGIKRRTISQQFDSNGNPVWNINIAEVRSLIGQQIDGQIITSVVEPYDVNGRSVSTYTTVVFAHENVETVFKNAGHPITVQPVAESQPVASEVEDLA